MTIEEKSKFHRWLFENFSKLSEFEPEEGDLPKAVNELGEIFEFARISNTGAGSKVWNFRGKTEFKGKNTFSSYARYQEFEIRVWKQTHQSRNHNGKLKMSIVLSYYDDADYSWGKKTMYLHTAPLSFLEETMKIYNTHTTSKKFGL